MLKRTVLILSILTFCAVPVLAQVRDDPVVAIEKNTGGGLPFAFEQITVDNTAGGKPLTAATYTTDAKVAFITAETAQMRYRFDGVAAVTTSAGHLLEVGQSIVLSNYSQIVKFRAIRTGGTSGVISVTYLK